MADRHTPSARVAVVAAMLVGVLAGAPSAAIGQTQPAQPAAAPATPAAQAAGAAPPPATQPPPPAFTYDPEGRRDPFLSLANRGSDGRPTGGKRAEGLAGLAAGEVVLKGIMQTRGIFVAMVVGPDNKTHVARPNDRLVDGRIKAITADTLVILQEVNDPLSLTKQREIRKSLHGLDEVK
jgi:Tfp pilus assembly protein PilP